MGDTRFIPFYERVAAAEDPVEAIRALSDEGVVAALAAASRRQDPLLANVLATEAQNRMRRCRAALDNLEEGVCMVDVAERIIYLNPAARRLLAWNLGDLIGVSFHGSVHGFDNEGQPIPPETCLVMEAMRARRTRRCEEETFTRANGTTFRAGYTVAPALYEGEVDGAVRVFSDVTRRKATEALLRESEARWRALAEAAFEGILVHDAHRVLDANRAAREMVRIAGEARDIPLMDFVAPSSREEVREIVLRAPHPIACSLECRRQDGSVFSAEALSRAFPYRDREARVVAIREALRLPPLGS